LSAPPRSLIGPPDSRISSVIIPLMLSRWAALSGLSDPTTQSIEGCRFRTTERRSSFSSELKLSFSDIVSQPGAGRRCP